MNNKIYHTIYLGGTIPYERADLEKHFKDNEELREHLVKKGFKVLDPCRGKDWNMDKHMIHLQSNGRDIAIRDLNDIDNSQLMIARMYLKESIGTSMEIFYMGHILRRPVITISYNERVREHPWIKAFSTMIFSDREKALEYIVENYSD